MTYKEFVWQNWRMDVMGSSFHTRFGRKYKEEFKEIKKANPKLKAETIHDTLVECIAQAQYEDYCRDNGVVADYGELR